jgi:hypothetical protein
VTASLQSVVSPMRCALVLSCRGDCPVVGRKGPSSTVFAISEFAKKKEYESCRVNESFLVDDTAPARDMAAIADTIAKLLGISQEIITHDGESPATFLPALLRLCGVRGRWVFCRTHVALSLSLV